MSTVIFLRLCRISCIRDVGTLISCAQEINVPTSRIQDILHNRRKITVDTSLRLAKFFGVSDGYFMALQDDIDIRNAKLELAPQLEEIKTYAYA